MYREHRARWVQLNPEKAAAAAKPKAPRPLKRVRPASDRITARAYYKKNAAALRAYGKAWRAANRHKRNAARARQLANDPQARMAYLLRKALARALRQTGAAKAGRTIELLGCSFQFFADFIEAQFTKGMTWQNRGASGWHLDHIIPVSHFDLSNPEQQRRCFHYTNLRPLWAVDNLRKGDSVPNVHQPIML
jgi:hypothetical protein